MPGIILCGTDASAPITLQVYTIFLHIATIISFPYQWAFPRNTFTEVIFMAKQGMKRPEPERRKNDHPPVPEISGKAKHGHQKAAPLIPEGDGRVFHNNALYEGNDLAIDNLMNGFDMTPTDVRDLWQKW